MPLTVNSASFFDPNYPGAEQGTTRLVWSKNVVFIDLQAPSDWATNNTYFVEIEVGVCDSISLLPSILLNSAIEEPDENGTLIFEIQKFIDDYEGIKVPVPNYNSTQVEIHKVPKFYVKVFENIDGVRAQKFFPRMNGGVEMPSGIVIPASSWRFDAIQAGLDRENFNYQLQQNWIYDTDKRKFLTSVEDRKSSHKLANEFLYWYGALPNLDSLSVFSKIYYDDNTEEDIILFDSVLIGSDIQCVPTRYNLIKEKSTFPLKNIEAWSIYIAYNGNRASEYFRYELPDQPNREAKNFLYRNSLGVFDTLVCAGDFEEYLESESSYASIKDKINYEVSEAQKLLISQTGKRGGTANTAFLNRDQADSKQDFILSKEVLVQDKNQFIPVKIEKNKQIYNIKNTSLIGYSFEYEHAHNVSLYTKDILRPKLGEVVSPPALPKFYIKNTGLNGYVRVEYDSIIVDIVPGTEQAIEIIDSTSVKVTWLIVNPDTLLLDASRINIAYPNYAFPARLDIATFDSVVQAGTTVVGIADENTVKRARTFTFIMPNNDYVAEVKFTQLKVVDIDFENPSCYILSGGDILTVKDRLNLFTATQTTPTYRHQFVGNALRCSPRGNSIGARAGYSFLVPSSTTDYSSIFIACQIHAKTTTQNTDPYGQSLSGATDANSITGSKILTVFGQYYGTSIGASSREDYFAGYKDKRALNTPIGVPTPTFSMSANLNKNLVFSLKEGGTIPTLYADSVTYNYSNVYNLGFSPFNNGGNPAHFRWYILPNNVQGEASVKRIVSSAKLTAEEYTILQTKFKEKYP